MMRHTKPKVFFFALEKSQKKIKATCLVYSCYKKATAILQEENLMFVLN